ncbi:hypothetical protein DQ04_25901000, partial [Trypanosoma grayi]|uniref:hypothetical protein n=1 Tax=Trypanosoma grayi TaxID=71804 RepID=UPI0004F459DB
RQGRKKRSTTKSHSKGDPLTTLIGAARLCAAQEKTSGAKPPTRASTHLLAVRCTRVCRPQRTSLQLTRPPPPSHTACGSNHLTVRPIEPPPPHACRAATAHSPRPPLLLLQLLRGVACARRQHATHQKPTGASRAVDTCGSHTSRHTHTHTHTRRGRRRCWRK